jgi:hypothetical protein
VTALGAKRLASILYRIEIPSEVGIATLSHLLRLLDAHASPGQGLGVPHSEYKTEDRRQAIEHLQCIRATTLEQLLPGDGRGTDRSEYFELSERGCRYRVASRRSEAGEQHPGQVLSALAEVGIPLTQTAISGHHTFCVSDLVDECADSFGFDEEIEWRSVALALYRPQMREWKNRRDEVVSFDAIAKELLRRMRTRGSIEHACWGTHSLYALAILLSVDATVPLWQDRSLRSQVDSMLRKVGERLAQSQLSDGSWDENWELPTLARDGTSMNGWQRLLISGHHLEWLALVPSGLRPPDRVLRMAGEFILQTLFEVRSDELVKQICPCSHGLRAFGIAGIQIVDHQ